LKYDLLAGFGSYDDSNDNSFKRLSSITNSFGTTYGTYGTYGNNLATSNNIALTKESTGNYKSHCQIADFGDDPGIYS
jgi:hypothetical protein